MKEEVRLDGPSLYLLPLATAFIKVGLPSGYGPIRFQFLLPGGGVMEIPMTDEAAEGLAESLKKLGY